ncbi:DEAD/DEAH box helicase [Bartonella schoenbuchensis]|uniref:ATP-dependent RNA helicase RhlE n=1 Tax=Bartonella schoenbuchensis m07a TaxID=1094496 RepID=N6VF60_9HYPH|nr:DEAD/DEAH box helicase [Bartonella schoenbuchensis]ENN91891.1 ATP-dependent RNA helicase RhlE [Bartonella schoenbuchensis m07a]
MNIKENAFIKLGIPTLLTENLFIAGINKPKLIQKQAIPVMLKKRDILGIAQTGSGKTLAFGLPVLSQILALGDKRYPKTARALILVPTRELAVQIEESIRMVAKGSHLSTCLILGGVSRFAQIKRMKTGVDVLIATPGRLMDLVSEKCIDLSQSRFLVLDEADRMLDMGFIRDVQRIAKLLHEKRQTALFSATMPREIVTLAKSLLNEPVKIEIVPQGTVATEITQKLYCVPTSEKKSVLNKLLTDPALASVIIFTRTKHGADAVARSLTKAGYSVAAIHGNKSHAARQRALKAFREGSVGILVATDIAARGIDVPGVSHVINYDLPDEAENYVHRIGRTGRNDTSGNAITLFDEKVEQVRLRAVERVIRMKLVREDIPPQIAAFPEKSLIPENDKKHCFKKSQCQKQAFDHIDQIKQSHTKNSSSKNKRCKKAKTTTKRAKSFRFRKSIKQVA